MSIQVKGLDNVLKNLQKQTDAIKKQVDGQLTEGAKKIEERAQMLAPVDRGLLRGNIVADISIFLHKRIVCNTFYAPYIEFGTKRKFDANGREAIAAQFKGKNNKGNFDDFVDNLAEWIRRKGVLTNGKRGRKRKDDTYRLAAYWMAIRILQNGIKPQPFFFRAYDEVLPTIIGDLQKIVK